MKHCKLSWLIMLALLAALLIPAAALAEGETMTFSSTSFTAELPNNVSRFSTGITASFTNLEEYNGYHIIWSSSDKNAVRFDYDEDVSRFYYDDGDTISVPDLYGIKPVDKATITGTLYSGYWNQEEEDALATATFDVKLTEIKLTALAFAENTPVALTVGDWDNYDTYVVGTPNNSTYAASQYYKWSISSDAASVTNYGQVEARKAGKATLTVTSTVDPTITKSIELTIKDPEKKPEEKKAFTKIEFNMDSLVMHPDDSENLNSYLTIEEPLDCNDTLIVTSSNPNVVEYDRYDGRIRARKIGSGVVITAQSKLNPEIKDTLTVSVEEKDPIQSMSFTKDAFTVTTADRSINLHDFLVTDPVDRDDYSDTIVWTSSNPKVASVDDNGYVNFHVPGTAIITARSQRNPEKAFATCTLTIEKEPLKKITFNSHFPTELPVGSSLYLWKYVDTDPYYYGEYESYQSEITWSVSNVDIATANNGNLYTYKPGKVTITAVYDQDETVKGEATVEVKAVPAKKAFFDNSSYTLKTGEAKQVRLQIRPKDASNLEVYFDSSDPAVASINDYDDYNCWIAAEKAGTATITATVLNADGTTVIATCTVTVTDPTKVTAIAFKKEAYTVDLPNGSGEEVLTLNVTPVDGEIDWDELWIDSTDDTVAKATYYEGNKVTVGVYAPGSAEISIKSRADDTVLAKTTITAKPIKVKAVKLPKASVTLSYYDDKAWHEYNETEIKAIIKPADAWYEATWDTTDASVAFVDGYEKSTYGTLVANGVGTCTITLSVKDGDGNVTTATMEVKVVNAKVRKIKLNKSKATITMIKGEDNTLQLTAIDATTEEPVPVTWKSSNSKIAAVDKTGLVTAKKAGTATITATTKDGNEVTATCKVTVKKNKVKSIKPSPKKVTMSIGEEVLLTVTVKPANAYDPSVSFKSSNAKIVAVDKTGTLTAKKVGKATITITAKDGSKKSAKVSVVVKLDKNGDLVIEPVDFETSGSPETQFVSEGSEGNIALNFE